MANAKNLARLPCKILYNQDKLKFIIKGGKAVEMAYGEFQKYLILQVPVSNIPTPKIIPALP